MKTLNQCRFFMWYFSRFKVPLIGYLKPKLMQIDDTEIVIKVTLNRRSKNHLNSMYFGALSIGADLAGGLHGFYHAKQAKVKMSLAFKSFQAEFLRRPETDVYFVCNQGEIVKEMVQKSKISGERINQPIEVNAYINYPKTPETVARFILELSLKVLPHSIDKPTFAL